MRPFFAKPRVTYTYMYQGAMSCVHEMYHGNPGGEVVGGQCCQLLVRFFGQAGQNIQPSEKYMGFL